MKLIIYAGISLLFLAFILSLEKMSAISQGHSAVLGWLTQDTLQQQAPANNLGRGGAQILLPGITPRDPLHERYDAINRWIVLNGLFNGGLNSENFNKLDPISQWVILNGLFGNGHPNDMYNSIDQWIVLNGLFGNGQSSDGFNKLSPLDQWIILNGLFGNDQN